MTVLCRRSHHRFTFEGFPTASAHVWGCGGPPTPAGGAAALHLAHCCFSTTESSPVTAGAQPFTSDRPGPPSSARSTVASLSFSSLLQCGLRTDRTHVHLFCTLCQLETVQLQPEAPRAAAAHVDVDAGLQSRCQKKRNKKIKI